MTVPLNMVGYQHPKDGVGYIGIGFTQAVNLREAVVGKLNTTLQPGHSYCVGFYMNVANKYGYIVDEISLFFSKDSIHTIDYTWNNNSLTPQVNINIGGITDTLGWTYVSGSFVASGEEEFFILSNFQDNPNWFQYNDSSISTDMTTYYYIDSISLVDCTPPNFDIVIPNLLSPNGDGINDKYVILNLPPDSRVSFFNRWGNELYSTSNYLNEWDGKYMGNLLPTGTYFVVVQFSDGTTKGTFIELMY